MPFRRQLFEHPNDRPVFQNPDCFLGAIFEFFSLLIRAQFTAQKENLKVRPVRQD